MVGRNEFDQYGVSKKFVAKMVFLAIGVILVLSFVMWAVDLVHIAGDEVGVVHKYIGGVQKDTLPDGWHFVFLGEVHNIDIGQKKLTFSEKVSRGSEDKKAKNEFSSIEVNCGVKGGQSAWIHISASYNVKPSEAVNLWNDGIADDYDHVILKRAIINAVNKNARPKEALAIYSGTGFNQLQQDVRNTLKEDPVVKYFNINEITIYQIKLNPKYENEIELKQLAKQKRLTAIEQAAAAVQKAAKAKEEAQINLEQRRAAAEASKIKMVKGAEAIRDERILAAKADMEEQRLDGEGIRDQKIAQAEGILKYGLAEAAVELAKKEAMYSGEAGARRASVEITGLLAGKLSGMLSGVDVISDRALELLMREGGFVPEILIISEKK